MTTSDAYECFAENCTGTVRKVKTNFQLKLNNGEWFDAEALMLDKCDKCGEVCFSPEASECLEAQIEKKCPNYFAKK